MARPKIFVLALLLTLTAAVLASPGIDRGADDGARTELHNEWRGNPQERQQLAKAFARRWALWTVLSKHHLRQALVEGDWDAWGDTGIPQWLTPGELEELKGSITAEHHAAFRRVEELVERFWEQTSLRRAEGLEDGWRLSCYPPSVIGQLVDETMEMIEQEWTLAGPATPRLQRTAATFAAPPEWAGSVADREQLEARFARRWVFWTLMTRHGLRQAFRDGDWDAWQDTGIPERLAPAELEEIRAAVTPEHLAAFEELDGLVNSAWIFPRSTAHCYPTEVIHRLVGRTLALVEREWRVTR